MHQRAGVVGCSGERHCDASFASLDAARARSCREAEAPRRQVRRGGGGSSSHWRTRRGCDRWRARRLYRRPRGRRVVLDQLCWLLHVRAPKGNRSARHGRTGPHGGAAAHASRAGQHGAATETTQACKPGQRKPGDRGGAEKRRRHRPRAGPVFYGARGEIKIGGP